MKVKPMYKIVIGVDCLTDGVGSYEHQRTDLHQNITISEEAYKTIKEKIWELSKSLMEI